MIPKIVQLDGVKQQLKEQGIDNPTELQVQQQWFLNKVNSGEGDK